MADDGMTTGKRPPAVLSDDLIETICGRLAKDQRVRRFLPEGGNVHLERRLPFLFVYRRPSDRADSGTRSLIAGQSAHLVAPGGEEHLAGLQDMLSRITAQLAEAFGAFLLVEVWTAQTFDPDRPDFQVVAPHDHDLPIAVQKFAEALRGIPTVNGNATVEIRTGQLPAPPSLPELLPREHLKKFAVLSLGLELQPFFRDPATGTPFPRILQSLQRHCSIALQRGAYEFVRLETTQRPANYHVLGRGAVLRVVWEADRALADVNDTFDFLLAVTPYNLPEAWKSFEESGFGRAPAFRYRPLTVDPALLKRRLYQIVLDPLEDPALADLFRDKRNELDLQLTMLESRETPRFLYGGLQLYGAVDDPLRELADRILSGIPPSENGEEPPRAGEPALDAAAFARLARAEVEAYRGMGVELDPTIEIRADVTSLMVSRGNLLIAADTQIPPTRARALIHHEVGTHMLTYFNATAQPLHLLRCGLPGYEDLQEGLAVLAEFLAGGLGRARLRLLAARVLVSDRCTRGATFLDAFRLLFREHGFSARTAFHVTMRVYRGGGFVKDQLYLKGLAQVLRYLEGDGALRPLWVGKIGFDHIPVIEELLWRGVLEPPRLEPRYLTMNGARQKLELLRDGVSVLDLIPKEEEWRSASS